MTSTSGIALVTGGTSGIGEATLRELRSAGFQCRTTFKERDSQAQQLVDEGVVSSASRLSLDNAEDVEAWLVSPAGVEATADVDVLVLNAGEILRPGDWQGQSVQDMLRTLQCHIVSPVLIARATAAGMAERRRGAIVFTSSTYGLTGAAGVLMYAAAKQALVSVTRSLARELGGSGVRVNCVMPGNIDTPMTSSAGPDVIAWVEGTTPLGRLGRPEDVARQTRFFIENDFVTGAVGVVDGGQILNM